MGYVVRTRRCIVAGLAVVLCIGIAGSVFAQQQKRLALVIGNANYANAPELRNPVNDARAMTAKLEQLHFKVITVLNGTYRKMLTSLNEFADELNRYDVALFYFSGHGVQYQGTNYLVPVNADIHRAVDIQFEALNATRVLADMGSSGTQVNIMVLDACRNNPFASQFRSLTRGLSVVQAPAGSMVVYSTAPDQVALDGKGKDSPFTTALLKHIETPGVSIQDMLTGVFQQVQQETHGEQIPWESSSLTVPFYFAPKPPEVAASPSQPETAPTQPAPSTAPSQAATRNPTSAPRAQSQASPSSAPQAAPSSAPSGAAKQPSQTARAQHGTALRQGPGKVVVNITTPELTSQARVELTGTAGSKSIVVSTNDFARQVFSLAPGRYNYTASLGKDPGIGHRGTIDVKSGQESTLSISLDYSPRYMVSMTQEKRDSASANLLALEKKRRKKGGGAAFLTLLGLASGVGTYFSYEAGASAYSSYQGATTPTSAQSYGSQARTYGTVALASGISGAVFLLWGFGELATRPSNRQISNLQGSISNLDAQIAALKAKEELAK